MTMHPLGHYSVCISGHSHGPLHYTQFASHSHESLLHEHVMLGTVEELVYVSEMNKTRTLPSDKLPTFFLKPKLMLCAVNFHILRAITNKNQTNIFLLYYGYS
jgi:hypothetical protein